MSQRCWTVPLATRMLLGKGGGLWASVSLTERKNFLLGGPREKMVIKMFWR